MPNRIIKESLCESEKIASLTDFEFRLWVTLLVLVDDAGRGDARPAIIKGRGFPLRSGTTEKNIGEALHSLACKGCIDLYEIDGRSYFYFPTWGKHQRLDRAKPKFPAPHSFAADCGELPQTAADCGLDKNPNTNKNTNLNRNPKSNTNTNALARVDAAGWTDLQKKFSSDMVLALGHWFKHKDSLGESDEFYTRSGLSIFCAEVQRLISARGEPAVVDAIYKCIDYGSGEIFVKPVKAAQSE